jgi:hypothetical protein
MAKRTWRWVTRDAIYRNDGSVCVWRNTHKPTFEGGEWVSSPKLMTAMGLDFIEYGHWLEVFGVPLRPGEIKKVRFICGVL